MADNRATAMQFLLDKGLTRAQAAGVVGSLMQESGLSTRAKNPSSGALGIGQWLGGRKTALLNSGKSGSLRGQLDFLWDELQGPERAALQRLKGARTVADAASAFTWGFERPGKAEANMANRVQQARLALKLGGAGGSSGSGGSTGRSTTTTTVSEDPSASVTAALDAIQLPERTKPEVSGISAPAFAARPVLSGQPIQTQAPTKERFDITEALKTIKLGEPTTTTTTTETANAGTQGASDTGQKGSKVLELIYNDGGKGYGIKNGQVVDAPSVYADVWEGHANHAHVAAGRKTVVALGKLAQSMGLHVGENSHFGGVDSSAHVPDSYHNKDEAIDVSGDAKKMAAFARAVERYNRTRTLPSTA